MQDTQLSQISNFIWGVADDYLRDLYVRGKYRDVILPMTVLRRLDAVLEPTKEKVLEEKKWLDEAGISEQSGILEQAEGQAFYNTSPFQLKGPDLPGNPAAAPGRLQRLPGRLLPQCPGRPREVRVPKSDQPKKRMAGLKSRLLLPTFRPTSLRPLEEIRADILALDRGTGASYRCSRSASMLIREMAPSILRGIDTEGNHMESIVQGAVAGLIAALAATTILGLARYARQWWANRQDVKYISELLAEGRTHVMEARDMSFDGMGATASADSIRATQYNRMIKELGVALERRTIHLSHRQRKDIYDALDWYHDRPDALFAIKRDGKVVFQEIPDGKWPTVDMSLEAAREKFDTLQSIKWLKLKADYSVIPTQIAGPS